MNLSVGSAKRVAITAHGNQKYGEYPYWKHLSDVVMILDRFGFGTLEYKVAAWLHDTVEDTDLTIDQVKKQFGDRVAELVWAVTNEPGKNRKTRHEKTYPKIRNTPGAIILKLADRIANVEQSLKEKDKLLGMYKDEYNAFRSALYIPGQKEEDMWTYLDSLLGDKDELAV